MNTTPDTPTKEFDESIEEKGDLEEPDKVEVVEDTVHFKKVEIQVRDNGHERIEQIHVEDRFLSRIAIKGRGWKRLKYIFTLIGIAISIITRYFLPVANVECIQDKTHEWLEPVNTFLHQHTDVAFWIKFMYTLMIDLWAVLAIFHWVVISLKWQFALDLLFFYTWRFICTRLISYRNVEGQFWPESSFMSLSNAGLSEQQYQVSAYTGVLVCIMCYWIEQQKKSLTIITALYLCFSVFIELSFRIAYSTDIFAGVLIAHLGHILNRQYASKFDDRFNEFLRHTWEQLTVKDDSRP